MNPSIRWTRVMALVVSVGVAACSTDTSTEPSAGTLDGPRFANSAAGPSVSGNAAQAVDNLIAVINGMHLPFGVQTSLVAPLKNMNTNNKPASCGKLGAFVNELDAKSRNGQLTSSQASQLLQMANAIRVTLGCIAGGTSPAWAPFASGTTERLFGIWGSSASDVYVAADNAKVLHYNGTAWSAIPSFPINPLLPPGTYVAFFSVWGSSAADVWVMGGGGTISHYNGSSWSADATGAAFIGGLWQSMLGVTGTSSSDVWGVGSGGTTIHFNGTNWSTVPTGLPLSVWLYGVYASSPTNVWAVGDVGTIIHNTGAGWSTVPSGTTNQLYGIWGTSASNVWAVGSDIFGGNGIVLHYNGSAWSSVSIPTTEGLNSVWGTSASDVWAVGNNWGGSGTIIHFDGTSWSLASSGTIQYLSGVWAASASDAWSVGNNGTILHFH